MYPNSICFNFVAKYFTMKNLVLIGVLCVLMSCGLGKDNGNIAILIPLPNSNIAQSDTFNQSFLQLMEGYYTLTDNFSSASETAIDESAKALLVLIDSFPIESVKADTSLVFTARSYTDGIRAELQGLLGEQGLDKKRMALQMISEQLYELIRTVQYSGSVIYYFYCAEAIDDQGAYWLGRSSAGKNPYLSAKATDCTELKDSIDYRIPQ